MPGPQLILPRADAGCGKVFYADRGTADEHRIALEFWNQATGHVRNGYHLAVFRCKRCGGFHIGQKRTEKLCVCPNPLGTHPGENLDRSEERHSIFGVDMAAPQNF
jgi:hypothetical protein